MTVLGCDHHLCRERVIAASLEKARTVALGKDWTASYEGPGHGWVYLCPVHRRPV